MASQEAYQAVVHLWKFYLHMRAWECAEYGDLNDSDRAAFTAMVETKCLFDRVEECKRDVLRNGVTVPDEWLSVLCAGQVAVGNALAEHERNHLDKILYDIYPLLCRLEVGAEQPDDPVPAAHKLSDPDSPSRWARRFGMSPRTFKRHVKSGQIRAKVLTDRSYRVYIDDLPATSSGQK